MSVDYVPKEYLAHTRHMSLFLTETKRAEKSCSPGVSRALPSLPALQTLRPSGLRQTGLCRLVLPGL